LYGSSVLALLCFIQIFYTPVMTNAATPTIANVSGTVQNGQILTVTGSNMMNENVGNWDSFFSSHSNAYGFEGSSPSSDFYCDLGPCSGAYDTTVKLSGSKSIKFHTAGSHSSNQMSYNAFTPASSGARWYRFYTRWHANSWPDSWMKMFYLMGGATNNFYFEPYANGGSNPSQMIVQVTNNNNVTIPTGPLQNDRWYLFEVYATGSNYQIWMDGTQIFNGSNGSFGTQSWLFGIVNECCSSNGSFDYSMWIDNMATSSSRIYPSSLVEISNSATYGSGTIVYQEPVYLSDGSVQIKANLSGLGSGPYYLWVTNNSQTRSSAYLLSGGGTASSTPLPPTIIYVQ
ncbi:MAG TPA: hypothetical protein VLX29_06290, partial [Nitrospirota bacterium]|nr:hypothetical protein [Nitrospirota bacterium]